MAVMQKPYITFGLMVISNTFCLQDFSAYFSEILKLLCKFNFGSYQYLTWISNWALSDFSKASHYTTHWYMAKYGSHLHTHTHILFETFYALYL